jgi:hypothetical protein
MDSRLIETSDVLRQVITASLAITDTQCKVATRLRQQMTQDLLIQ